MSKKSNNSQSVVFTNPTQDGYNILAAYNPQYGGVQPSASDQQNVLGGPMIGTPNGVAVATPKGNIPVNTPTQDLRQQNAGLVDNGTEPQTVKEQSGLGKFFSNLGKGVKKVWNGSNPSLSDSGAVGYLGSLYTTPEQEARYLKQSQNKMKLMALGDAIRQFGNVYYTANYATPQKFENIYDKERARYLQDKAMRDRDNQYYIQQKTRDAQMQMQREKIAAEAERANRDLAMKKEINDIRKNLYGNQAKKAEYEAKIRELEAENTPTRLENQNEKAAADYERVVAQTNKTKSDAANNTRRTNAQVANYYDTMAKRKDNSGGGSSGGSGGGGRGSSGSSAPVRFSGRKGSYARKQQPTKAEIDDMYQDAVSRGYVDKKNQQMVSSGQQSKAQVINKVATYTKDADTFFKRHGYTKVYNEDKQSSQQQKSSGKKKSNGSGKGVVNMNVQRGAAVNKLNKLKGASV